MSKNDKYEVTAKWHHKLIAMVVLFLAAFYSMTAEHPGPTLSLFVYMLLFVYLSVWGTNNKIALWIAERKLFMYIFFMPTFICAFYSGALLFDSFDKPYAHLASFSALLTILSLPYAFLLMRFRGGIRKLNSLYAFMAFPIVLFIVCRLFAKQSFIVAAIASFVVFLICFIISFIQYDKDHHADYASADDKAERGDYKAVWESRPDSEVRNNVIHLRGTIVIQYYGDYYNKDRANELANSLIQSYVHRVHSEMKGYSINSASVTIKSQRMG